ncbi:MAG: MFS transporter [Cypionkella sp.]
MQFLFFRRHTDFALFWAGMLLVNIAVQIEAVTIGWQIYQIGRQTLSIRESAFLVGMVGLAQFIPMFLLTLYAGSVADRHSRRLIVLISLGIEILCVLGLVSVAHEVAPQVRHIFWIATAFGAARAFLSPASSALVPMLVPKADMPQAISLKSLSWQAAVIVGPWIGGLLCAVSAATAYEVTAVLYLAGAAIILFMGANTTPIRQPGSQIAQIKEGLIYVWTNKIVFGAISLDLFAVLLGGATALLPAFATDILNVGPEGLWPAEIGPRHWRFAHGRSTLALAFETPCGAADVAGGGGVWVGHGDIWPVEKHLPVCHCPCSAWCGRHDLGLCAPNPCTNRHPRPYARTGVLGLGSVHLWLQRIGRVQIRRGLAFYRPCRSGYFWRHWHHDRDRSLGRDVPILA